MSAPSVVPSAAAASAISATASSSHAVAGARPRRTAVLLSMDLRLPVVCAYRGMSGPGDGALTSSGQLDVGRAPWG